MFNNPLFNEKGSDENDSKSNSTNSILSDEDGSDNEN